MGANLNPFPHDADRGAIWDMLASRDIDAFLARDWAMVEGDFIADGFFGLHAHGSPNPDGWTMAFPTLSAYRDECGLESKGNVVVPSAPPRSLSASYNCAGPSSTSFKPSRTFEESSACLLIVECAASASITAFRISFESVGDKASRRRVVQKNMPATSVICTPEIVMMRNMPASRMRSLASLEMRLSGPL